MNQEFEFIESFGKQSENYIFNSDNLPVLDLLSKLYPSKIGLIYIDPPYNTGKKIGKYNDNFKSHQNWLEFMRPRLILAKDLMEESAVIAISIGEQEEAHLKLLCNEIFGEENKISCIIWQSKYTVANDKSGISTQTEYILIYAKNHKKTIIKQEPLKKEYVEKAYKNIDNDSRGLWRGGIQLYKKKNKYSYAVKSPTGKEWIKPWNFSQESWKKLEEEKLIYWGKDGNSCPTKKVFLSNNKGTPNKNLWLGQEVGFTLDGGNVLEKMFGNRNSFLYPKPVSLLKKIINIFASNNAIILDFFAGSGTLGQAVLELNAENFANRNFMLVTNDENEICSKVLVPRLKKIIEGYSINTKKENIIGTSGGFNYYSQK